MKSPKFSNLIGNYYKFSLFKYPKVKTICISGCQKNVCSGDSTFFEDSTFFPFHSAEFKM
jgi:hypothetical protein